MMKWSELEWPDAKATGTDNPQDGVCRNVSGADSDVRACATGAKASSFLLLYYLFYWQLVFFLSLNQEVFSV